VITLQPSSAHLSTGRDAQFSTVTDIKQDPSVFGDDADVFDPDRTFPDGIATCGLSFGLGMHACIGQDLAAGFVGEPGPEHLLGLVPVAVQVIFDHGSRPDPDDPPEMDASTSRPYFGPYPVVFDTTT
jgi:hypothetical protein